MGGAPEEFWKRLAGDAWSKAQDLLEPHLADAVRPWAEKLKAAQEAADVARHPDRFDSFKQVSKLEEQIKGRGNDPVVKAKVEAMADKIQHNPKPADLPTQTPYEAQKAQEDAWE